MRYGHFLRELLKYTLSGSLALGMVLAAVVAISGANGNITFDIGFSRMDGLYLALGIPLVLTLLVLLVSPLAWLLARLPGLIRSSS